ncbi:MAG: GMP synthase subunit A [Candidatus Hydrothermarchaeota archaeon]
MVDILILDNYGQYTHRIYRTLRYLNVEAKIVPNTISVEEIAEFDPVGVILSGGPDLDRVGNCESIVKELNIPILGICLGHQLIAKTYGGKVARGMKGEYAETEIIIDKPVGILEGLGKKIVAWASHMDEIEETPKDFEIIAHSEVCKNEAMMHKKKDIFGVQFHPEVAHTPKGPEIFKNFLKICRE